MSGTSAPDSPAAELDRRAHWEKIYRAKSDEQTSWFEPSPTLSLEFVGRAAGGRRDLRVLDVGAGTARLADGLLDRGFRGAGVLDVSPAALARTVERLGELARGVELIQADVLSVGQVDGFDIWHDRAMFHFLTEDRDVETYVATLARSIPPNGHAIIATFGPEGPSTCSGLPVHRYDEEELAATLGAGFALRATRIQIHRKPAEGTQQFLYCLFDRI